MFTSRNLFHLYFNQNVEEVFHFNRHNIFPKSCDIIGYGIGYYNIGTRAYCFSFVFLLILQTLKVKVEVFSKSYFYHIVSKVSYYSSSYTLLHIHNMYQTWKTRIIIMLLCLVCQFPWFLIPVISLEAQIREVTYKTYTLYMSYSHHNGKIVMKKFYRKWWEWDFIRLF